MVSYLNSIKYKLEIDPHYTYGRVLYYLDLNNSRLNEGERP